MFNYEHIGCYVHYLISGHVKSMLRRYDYCLSDFNCQGVEKMNCCGSVHRRNQTSKGAGKHPVHPALDMLATFGRKWLRLIDELFPGWLDEQRLLVTPEDKLNFRLSEILD